MDPVARTRMSYGNSLPLDVFTHLAVVSRATTWLSASACPLAILYAPVPQREKQNARDSARRTMTHRSGTSLQCCGAGNTLPVSCAPSRMHAPLTGEADTVVCQVWLLATRANEVAAFGV